MQVRINTLGNEIKITINGKEFTFPKTVKNSKISTLLNTLNL